MKVLNAVNSRMKKYSDFALSTIRRESLLVQDFSIISNNCWGGSVYRRYRLKYSSPTVGLYMFANEYIHGAKYYEGAELWDKLQAALADGREGMVIMQKKAPVYFKRTPARVSLKIKKELRETIDCFFTGRASAPTKDYTGKEVESWQYWINQYTDERLPIGNHYYEAFMEGKPYIPVTKPYYLHFAGSLEIGLVTHQGTIQPIGYLSGLTDEVKMNYKDYEKRVIEVGAMELNDTGGLRHAKMLGWRDDKTWEECSIDQLISL